MSTEKACVVCLKQTNHDPGAKQFQFCHEPKCHEHAQGKRDKCKKCHQKEEKGVNREVKARARSLLENISASAPNQAEKMLEKAPSQECL